MNNKLKKSRESLKLTQKQVADALGIAETAYQRYELGYSKPSVQRALAIAKVLKTTVEKLFN